MDELLSIPNDCVTIDLIMLDGYLVDAYRVIVWKEGDAKLVEWYDFYANAWIYANQCATANNVMLIDLV